MNIWRIGGSFLLIFFSMYSQASNNSSTAIHTISPSPVQESVVTPSGHNPFTGDSQTVTTYSTPALVMHEHELLSQEIRKWVEGNGYKLYWNSKKDYLIYNNITLSGKTDDEILQQLGTLFFSENYGFTVKKYQKNRVIVIDEM